MNKRQKKKKIIELVIEIATLNYLNGYDTLSDYECILQHPFAEFKNSSSKDLSYYLNTMRDYLETRKVFNYIMNK